MTTEERARELLSELNRSARDYDNYEYGLPMFPPEEFERLLTIAKAALRAAQAETWRAMKKYCEEEGAAREELIGDRDSFDMLAVYCEQQARQAETGTS